MQTARSYLLIIFFTGCLLLAAWGGWDYAKGRLDLRRTRNEALSGTALPSEIEEKEKRIEKSVYISIGKIFAGCLGVFMVIYTHTRRPDKYMAINYNDKTQNNP